MKFIQCCVLCWVLLFSVVLKTEAVTHTSTDNNLIREEERRGASGLEVKQKAPDDQQKSHSHRGLIVTGLGSYGGVGSHGSHAGSYDGSYGASGSGSGYDTSGGGGGGLGSYHSSGPVYGAPYHHHGGPSGPSGPEPGSYGDYGYSAPGGGSPHPSSGHNALALKGLLIPLAGLVLLGAAAALTTNPILLQLGAFSGRRRRRRDTGQEAVDHLHNAIAKHI